MKPTGGGRPGVTLPELIFVAWLFALVLLALARFATAQGRLAAESQDRIRAADVRRTVDLVLTAELRHLAPPDRRIEPDSIRIRAVRGTGVVCQGEADIVRLRYEGIRRPDPTKDSVLLITGLESQGTVHGVVDVAASDTCGDGYRLRLDPPPTTYTGLAMVFETGSYHLSGGALRYRRGRGGRQPVTEAVLDDGWFEATPTGVTVRISINSDSLPRLRSVLRGHPVRFLNGPGRP